MTRLHLLIVGLLSTLATIAVLAGSDGGSRVSAAAAALLGGSSPVVTTPVSSTTPATAAAADAAATSEDAADASDALASTSDATDPVATTYGDDTTTTDDDSSTDSDTPAATTPADAPKETNADHVFVITLAGLGFERAFGSSSSLPYLAELRAKGLLLPNVSSLGRSGLADRLALISGQPPTAATRTECGKYTEIPPDTKADDKGVISADGCVYPLATATLPDQLAGNQRTWKAYAEDYEKGPRGASVLCRRPASDSTDESQTPRPGDTYATRNVPFAYFHSLIDYAGCDGNVGALDRLDTDLKTAKTTPSYAWVAPGLCSDGSTTAGCDGRAGGTEGADAFLRTWVPKILDSPAYKEAGALFITFAGGPADGPDEASRNGALVVSRFVQAGTTEEQALDPYGLLRITQELLEQKTLVKSADAPSLLDTSFAAARKVTLGDD